MELGPFMEASSGAPDPCVLDRRGGHGGGAPICMTKLESALASLSGHASPCLLVHPADPKGAVGSCRRRS